MRDGKRLLLGAMTVWPLLYIFGFLAFVLFGIGGGDIDPTSMMLLMSVHMLSIFGIFGLMVYYVIHVMKNEALSTNKKVIWAICLVKLGIFAMPVYWYSHLWQARHKLPSMALETCEEKEVPSSMVPLGGVEEEEQSALDLNEFDRRLAEVPVMKG